MRVASLGHEGASSSLILEHEGRHILLDCPAVPVVHDASAQQPSQQQQQQQQQSPQLLQLAVPNYAAALQDTQLQAILLTSAWGLLGLAHLQQQLQAKSQDLPVHTYCTEPCLHFFQQQAQELLDAQTALQSLQQQQQPDVSYPPQGNHPRVTPTQQHGDVLVPLFSPEQLQSVLDTVQVVRFGQRVLLPGCFGITAEARPSGSGIGCCLWLLTCGNQRYTYLAAASLAPGPSAPLHQASLHDVDVLLLAPGCIIPQQQQQQQQQQTQLQQQQTQLQQQQTQLQQQQQQTQLQQQQQQQQTHLQQQQTQLQQQQQQQTHLQQQQTQLQQQQQQQLLQQPQAADDSLADAGVAAAINAAAAAVARGGRVLVPVFPGEVAMLQLLECLPAALAASLPTVQQPCLLYLSPAAADALATANSCCEYLEQRRQLGVLASGTPPFPDAQLTKSRQLLILAPANDSTSSSGSGSGGGGSQCPVWGTEAEGVAGGMAVDGGGLGSDRWGPALQQVLAVGPCVVFVPVCSLAAGPGASLTKSWCSDSHNMLLLLPESSSVSAAWLHQCCLAGALPPRLHWHWQVHSAGHALEPAIGAAAEAAAAAAGGSVQGPPQSSLTAEQLVAVLGACMQGQAADSTAKGQSHKAPRTCQVVASARDVGLLSSVLGQQRSTAAHLKLLPLPSCEPGPSGSQANGSSNGSSSLLWAQVDLPAPLVQASLSAQLADRLQLQRLKVTRQQAAPAGSNGTAVTQVRGVSVARVQALLTHRSGAWHLEPVPAEQHPQVVPAVLDQQQPQQELLWGTIDVQQLLSDLQAAGFSGELMPPAAGAAPTTQPPATVISVHGGLANIRLSQGETEVVCDSASMRQSLLQCLLGQLQSIR